MIFRKIILSRLFVLSITLYLFSLSGDFYFIYGQLTEKTDVHTEACSTEENTRDCGCSCPPNSGENCCACCSTGEAPPTPMTASSACAINKASCHTNHILNDHHYTFDGLLTGIKRPFVYWFDSKYSKPDHTLYTYYPETKTKPPNILS